MKIKATETGAEQTGESLQLNDELKGNSKVQQAAEKLNADTPSRIGMVRSGRGLANSS